ncbi:hypothetical protein BT93_H2801 [Corymbia citriodora subsp. variegata]|nr:hypothetical protein BT93_H2801 [Corymbia citriodora subsp. variegata]
MVESKGCALGSVAVESKEPSTEARAPSFTTGISPFTRSGCQSSGILDAPAQHPFGGLSGPFSTNSIVTTATLGTGSFSNSFGGPSTMPATTMPAHNSSIIRFRAPSFSFPLSKSISNTALSDATFTSRPLFSESPASGGSSIFLHDNRFSRPPAFSYQMPNNTTNFRPPSNSIPGCAALSEPATSTCLNSQPKPFWNSPFKRSTNGDGEKISNPAFPFGKSPF